MTIKTGKGEVAMPDRRSQKSTFAGRGFEPLPQASWAAGKP